MPETSPGLPPVGELVQITHRGRPYLARYTDALGGAFTTVVADDNFTLVGQVEWCRVLVLPDDDTLLLTRIGFALAENEQASDSAQARAALVALREAAIR